MQQPQLDLEKTTPILTPDGSKIWQQGYILRKASRFLTGSDADQIIPIPIFYDPISGEINKEGMPSQLDFLFKDKE